MIFVSKRGGIQRRKWIWKWLWKVFVILSWSRCINSYYQIVDESSSWNGVLEIYFAANGPQHVFENKTIFCISWNLCGKDASSWLDCLIMLSRSLSQCHNSYRQWRAICLSGGLGIHDFTAALGEQKQNYSPVRESLNIVKKSQFITKDGNIWCW